MIKDYNTRRHEIAEEMAKSSCGALYGPDVIEQFLPLADIALSHQAEAYGIGYKKGADCEDEAVCFMCDSHIQQYLLTTGLVPGKNEKE